MTATLDRAPRTAHDRALFRELENKTDAVKHLGPNWFAAVMGTVVDAARGGMPVLGICNGFQVLCESHLLPGALTRNTDLHFVHRDQPLRIVNTTSAWTRDLPERITIPVKNGEGRYVADVRTLDALEAEGRVIAYYDGNPNGSLRDIAGICNERGNVVGIMPHPEHAVEELTGPGTDGLGFFTSVLSTTVSA